MWSWLFKGKKAVEITQNTSEEPLVIVPEGFIMPQTVEILLSTVRCQKLLKAIWQRTSLSQLQFEQLYLKPIERYAALVQNLPASESHHHAYFGGMLEHGLEIMAYALKFRQSHLLPIGVSSEERSAEDDIWTAGIAYAALIHDIGKLAVDIHVEYSDGSVWHPWQGPLKAPYRFQYRKNREYRLHSASTGLLYQQILDTPLLDWLSSSQVLWSLFTYFVAGQMELAGIVGQLVAKADQASVSHSLGGNIDAVMGAPKHSLQRKLLDGLRYLIKEELKLNNSGPSDGWLTDEGLWLVSKTVSDKLRAYLLSQGIDGIPSKNSILFTTLQEHHIILSTTEEKAIWSATVTSSSNGWSQSFTFLKVIPSLIWPEEKPLSFDGSVVINMNNSSEDQVVDSSPDIASPAMIDGAISETHSANQPVDSLDSVLNLLEMNDINGTETVITIEDGVAINEPTLDNPLDNTTAIFTTSEQAKKIAKNAAIISSPAKVSLLKLTNSEKSALQKIDTMNPSGEHLIGWLKEGILNQKLIINEPQALVHTVDDTIFIITPGIFMRYVQEFPQVQPLAKADGTPAWRYMQKEFEKLGYHKRLENGLSIWTCFVEGPKSSKKVHGYLFSEPTLLIPDILYNNPYLKLSIE